MKEYFRMPYGTEAEGWSSIVTSDVQDTVEWILPALLKIFTSTDRAVSFDPVRAEDVDGAERDQRRHPPSPAPDGHGPRWASVAGAVGRGAGKA